MEIRLDKYLADMSAGTRSEVKKYIKAGRVQVDQFCEKDAARKIDPGKNRGELDGKQISYQKYEYYMLNKPAGVVSAVSDKKDRTVLDLISDGRKDLFPVGRLDKDTEGLLLITNDGELAHRMLSPRKHVDKKYYVRIDGNVTPEMHRKLEEGVFIEQDILSKPAKLKIINNQETESEVCITIHEGRFHQVKKMFGAVGRNVLYLERISFGPLVLDQNLPRGSARTLTPEERKLLEPYMDTKDQEMEES